MKEAQKRKNERQHIVYDRKGDFGFMVMTVRYVFSSPSTAEIYRILMGLSHDDDDVVVGGGGIFYDSYFRRIILFFSESSRCAFSQKKKCYDIRLGGWRALRLHHCRSDKIKRIRTGAHIVDDDFYGATHASENHFQGQG